uniref:Uncharacterized protein n=1 Tax=Chromera velia CCMP2878 TaxID=1169474 RepID=A0A0G4GCF6_9ALVE|mmetsp:Transcript_41810/g.82561  ORF Transcript_41810/g.82561 Transcript_41810/m.82561 type:complete len:378 (-) Transcript_41810:91-1224(-)|eukprot:Cvel_21279.t1-p1 / transcript=Cvel_21279.t1 / gene=Cvel_21279 / organism=Chromera_velia_CCMP2878 / gene_product=hypothetical protein / transcript_product=hypothetical protein / location=Cvel_scaffold1981:4826-9096(+) / protein_length=377 / sequence_SO=supercontig / SO=protein_coding / is_pseudo=false
MLSRSLSACRSLTVSEAGWRGGVQLCHATSTGSTPSCLLTCKRCQTKKAQRQKEKRGDRPSVGRGYEKRESRPPPLDPKDYFPVREPSSARTDTGWSDSWVPPSFGTPYKDPDNPSGFGDKDTKFDSKDPAAALGYEVPYKFKVVDDPISVSGHKGNPRPLSKDGSAQTTYTDFVGNRFPTLETSEAHVYFKDTGFDRFAPRVFPIKLPMARRLDPLRREYIHFLHTLDPQRFTVEKIAERYGLRQGTVKRVINEFGVKLWYRQAGIPYQRRLAKKEGVMRAKEDAYSKIVGYSDRGDADEKVKRGGSEDVGEEWEGWKATMDWVKRQCVEVEALSAFPLPSTRDPMPKQVDVDVVVKNTGKTKVMNWINPRERVVF